MKYATQHFGLAAVVFGCFGGVACESDVLQDPSPTVAPAEALAAEEQEQGVGRMAISAEERAQIAQEDKQIRCHEGTSPSELSIRWDEAPETSATERKAIVQNNGSVAITAEPVILAANPSLGESQERRLAPVTVAAGTEAVITVNVADFPVQSVGEATSVSIGLRWKRADMQAEMVSPQALSQPLFVTHDDASFRTAILRDGDSELVRQLARTADARPIGYRLGRAIALTGSKEFRTIERLNAPTIGVGTPAAITTVIDARQP